MQQGGFCHRGGLTLIPMGAKILLSGEFWSHEDVVVGSYGISCKDKSIPTVLFLLHFDVCSLRCQLDRKHGGCQAEIGIRALVLLMNWKTIEDYLETSIGMKSCSCLHLSSFMSKGVTSFSGAQRLHYQKPRTLQSDGAWMSYDKSRVLDRKQQLFIVSWIDENCSIAAFWWPLVLPSIKGFMVWCVDLSSMERLLLWALEPKFHLPKLCKRNHIALGMATRFKSISLGWSRDLVFEIAGMARTDLTGLKWQGSNTNGQLLSLW